MKIDNDNSHHTSGAFDAAHVPQVTHHGHNVTQLSAESAETAGYPIGCPVWYNFDAASAASKTMNGTKFCSGFINEVFINVITRKLVFKVKGEHTNEVTTILEGWLAYAEGCPIRLQVPDLEPEDGRILCAKPLFSEDGKEMKQFHYTLITFDDAGMSEYHDDVPVEYVSYRIVNSKTKNTTVQSHGDSKHIPKEQSSKSTPNEDATTSTPKSKEDIPQSTNSDIVRNAIKGLPYAAKTILCIAVSLCHVWGPTANISINSLQKYCVQAFHNNIMDEWGLENTIYLIGTLVESGLLIPITTGINETFNVRDGSTEVRVDAKLEDVEVVLRQKLLEEGSFYCRLVDYVRRECPYPC